MRINYNVDAHIPHFVKDDVEKTFYREFLTMVDIPNNNVPGVNEQRVKWFAEYLKTADFYESYWRTGESNLKSREQSDKKASIVLRQARVWVTWKYLLYRIMKRVRAGLYFKIMEETFLPEDIHPTFLTWMVQRELFGDEGMNRRMDVFEKNVTVHKIGSPTTNTHATTVRRVNGKSVKSSAITVEAVPITEALPDNLKKMPIIGGLDKDVSEMDLEAYRRHLTNVHVGNLHLIALSDEERSSDRIKASEIILKHVGAFELDNNQKKAQTQIPEETVKLLEYLKEKQNRLYQYVRELTPFDKEFLTVDVESKKIVSRQTEVVKKNYSNKKSTKAADKIATKIIEESRYDKNIKKLVDEDKMLDTFVNHYSKKPKTTNSDEIIERDANII
jgi:hypothetical protein